MPRDDLEKASAIETRQVRDAFLSVPQEIFISEVGEEKGIEAAYLDEAYPTKTDGRGDPISSSSPQIMARCLDRVVREVVDDWRGRGRPRVARLRVHVTWGASQSASWRSKRRGGAISRSIW